MDISISQAVGGRNGAGHSRRTVPKDGGQDFAALLASVGQSGANLSQGGRAASVSMQGMAAPTEVTAATAASTPATGGFDTSPGCAA